MGGTTTTNTSQQQQSQTSPWAPAQPMLTGILDQLGGLTGNVGKTPAETQALGALSSNANNSPSFAGPAQRLATDLFGGGIDRSGIVRNADDAYRTGLAPTAGGAYLDPARNPALRPYLDTIANDVTSSVNGTFAAAGRDLSGMNQQALARGIAQGEAPVLLNAYNMERGNQLGALRDLFAGGTNAATTLSGLDQAALANRLQGVGVANAVPGLQDQNANRLLAAEARSRGLPLQNLSGLESLLLPIAQSGSQTSGTGTGTQSQSVPAGPAIAGGVLGGLGMLAKLGFFA